MMAVPTKPGSQTKTLRWAIWGTFLAFWTFVLVTPFPVQAERELLPGPATFPLSKTLHVAGYAFFTSLSAWLQVGGGWRWGLLGFLFFHGAATEFLQCYVPLRTGCWLDVGLDSTGVLLGLYFTWPWWWERQVKTLGNSLAEAAA